MGQEVPLQGICGSAEADVIQECLNIELVQLI